METLIRDLLTYAKASSSLDETVTPIDLNEIVETVLGDLDKSKNCGWPLSVSSGGTGPLPTTVSKSNRELFEVPPGRAGAGSTRVGCIT